VTSVTPPPPDPPDRAPRALGDLLYPDPATLPVSEKEWVGLVQAIAAHDVRALHALYERTHRLVFTLITRITKSPDTAEELTLDVFNDVWQRASAYDPAAGSVVGWIMEQARLRALDRLRPHHRTEPVSPPGDSLPPRAEADADEAAALRVQGRLLREALTVLTPAQREAAVTAFFSEPTHDQMAVPLDHSIETVRTRIRSGLERLRQALTRTRGAP
jgi:RNA polymerase sigma-70 factor, ECF subfamily